MICLAWFALATMNKQFTCGSSDRLWIALSIEGHRGIAVSECCQFICRAPEVALTGSSHLQKVDIWVSRTNRQTINQVEKSQQSCAVNTLWYGRESTTILGIQLVVVDEDHPCMTDRLSP